MNYDNTNKIAVFKNNKKEKETQPDYTGTVNVEGKDYSVSLWIKEGKAGKFFAGKVQEPYKKDGGTLQNTSDKFKDIPDLPFQ